ncbi:MAG: permease-like cell division protein FtsX [Bacteroidota bacterium]
MKKTRKKKLGNYPYPSVVFTTTLALFIIGLLGVVLIKANKLKDILKSNIEIQVYLNKYTSENERIKLEKALASKDYVFKNPDGSAKVTFISKDSAAVGFVEQTGEDFLNFLGENPLLDAYVVGIDPNFFSKDQLGSIQEDLKSFSEIYEVAYQENLIEAINRNITRISIVLASIAFLLIIIVVILVNNTIRLAMFSQRFLIRSMQLVGAKPSFVKKPFLSRSITYSLISGILSGVIIYFLLNWSYSYFEELEVLFDLKNTLLLFAGIIILGVFLVFFSTLSALNKYLKLSLDDLY